MQKKSSLLSFVFGLIVLVALVLQSSHTFIHLEKELLQKQCLHHSAKNQSQFTHGHHNLDRCFVCEFTFSTAVKSDFFAFDIRKITVSNAYSFFYSKSITQSFRGSLFALRAPPSFII
ncbi:MAG: hypothetical protein RL108_1923 [Bacteroidota bacterium]|jgi:hypothetical protein